MGTASTEKLRLNEVTANSIWKKATAIARMLSEQMQPHIFMQHGLHRQCSPPQRRLADAILILPATSSACTPFMLSSVTSRLPLFLFRFQTSSAVQIQCSFAPPVGLTTTNLRWQRLAVDYAQTFLSLCFFPTAHVWLISLIKPVSHV